MKINLETDLDLTQFMAHQHIVAGEACTLVQPQHIGAKWNQKNKFFRSSLWNYNGELVSAGFCKFTNWNENPDNFPLPKSLTGTTIVEKLDGSLLIVAKYKGKYILRTRGTSDATKLDNGHELEIFKETILKTLISHFGEGLPLLGSVDETWNYSILFEWVSPLQKIVINYGDQPDWYLVGAINHHDYSLFSQKSLDDMAKIINVKRPVTYTFPSIEEMLKNVDAWKDKEGVVIYSKDGQMLHKCKSLDYLAKHRFKSEATLENTLDLYFSLGKPLYQEFERKLIEAFDYECFTMVRGYASNISDSAKEVKNITDGIDKFVEETLRPLSSRRLQAERVISAYGITNRSQFVFARLDFKPWNDEQLKKLFWQVLKD